jgi:hypothetical protein
MVEGIPSYSVRVLRIYPCTTDLPDFSKGPLYVTQSLGNLNIFRCIDKCKMKTVMSMEGRGGGEFHKDKKINFLT